MSEQDRADVLEAVIRAVVDEWRQEHGAFVGQCDACPSLPNRIAQKVAVHLLQVDFGYAGDGPLLPSRAVDTMRPGDAVILFDGEGNQCEGIIERIDAHLVWLLPDWKTWRPDRSPTTEVAR